MSFELHPQLAADCFVIGDLPLCRLLMLNDTRYPWFILVPRRAEIREIHHLEIADQQQFWAESNQLSHIIEALFTPDKLNVAALGNKVSQLHIHHIARYQSDDAWPAPVWGRFPALPYADDLKEERLAEIRNLLALTP